MDVIRQNTVISYQSYFEYNSHTKGSQPLPCSGCLSVSKVERISKRWRSASAKFASTKSSKRAKKLSAKTVRGPVRRLVLFMMATQCCRAAVTGQVGPRVGPWVRLGPHETRDEGGSLILGRSEPMDKCCPPAL